MKKKVLLITLPIVILLIAVTAVTILYFTTDLFVSTDKLFLRYFSQNANLIGLLKNNNVQEQKDFINSNSYVSNGNLTISIKDPNQEEQTINVATLTKHDRNTGRKYSEAILKNADADLLKMSYINSEDVYAIKCEDILSNYIGIRDSNLKEFAKNIGMDEKTISSMPDTINLKRINNYSVLTDEEKQSIWEKYKTVIIESIPKEKITIQKNQQIELLGENYNVNAYILELSGEELKQIMINCLTKLKEDQNILVAINSLLEADKANINNSTNAETQPNDLTTKITSGINNIITKLQNTTINNKLTITVYENNKNTLRTTIELSDKGKITIDMPNTDTIQEASILIEQYSTSYTSDINVEDINQIQTIQNTSASKISLKKTKSDNAVVVRTRIVPDVKQNTNIIDLTTSFGNIQNNSITNTSTVSINSEGQTITSTYNKTINQASQIEEIMELKNSNTVILNNYTKEQLSPFMENIYSITEEVLDSKLQQLNIDLDTSTIDDMNSLMNISNRVIKIIQIIASSGISIANANGVELENLAVPGLVVLFTYNQNASIIDHADEARKEQEAADRQWNEIEQNVIAYTDEMLNRSLSDSVR